MSIKKVVITAAGSGSRLLPFSKGVPKEMLPFYARSKNGSLILKPILQVIYESLYSHGFRNFCFIVGREKKAIEDYFTVDNSPRYSKNIDLQDFYKKLDTSHIVYIQQPSPKGFGNAVLHARMFAEDHPFLCHAGDDVILSPGNSHLKRLEEAFFSNNADLAFLVEKVRNPRSYGVVEGERIGKGIIRVSGVEEKPERPKTDLAIIAAYIFKSSIFDELESTKPDKTGEIQLTDAIKSITAKRNSIAVELEPGERRIDVGTPQNYIKCINNWFSNCS